MYWIRFLIYPFTELQTSTLYFSLQIPLRTAFKTNNYDYEDNKRNNFTNNAWNWKTTSYDYMKNSLSKYTHARHDEISLFWNEYINEPMNRYVKYQMRIVSFSKIAHVNGQSDKIW